MKANYTRCTSFLIALLFLSIEGNGQKCINQLFDEAKKSESSFAITVPKFLAKFALKKALLDDMEDEERIKFGQLISDLKKVRILVDEKAMSIPKESIARFHQSAEKDGLVHYAKIKSDGQYLDLYVKEEGDFLKELFFMVAGEQTVLIHLKAKIPFSIFKEIIKPISNSNPSK